MLVGNKSDIDEGESMKSYDLKAFEKQFEKNSELIYKYIRTSSKTGENVDVVFNQLLQLARFRRIIDKTINDLGDKFPSMNNIQFYFV